MADGILTPAVSVTSAVAGIAVAKPSVLNQIVPISIVFLFALFFIQQFGTSRLALAFAPGMLLFTLLVAIYFKKGFPQSIMPLVPTLGWNRHI